MASSAILRILLKDTARFEESLQFACQSFEASMQLLMRNLPTRVVKQTPVAEKSQKCDSQEKIRKATRTRRENFSMEEMCDVHKNIAKTTSASLSASDNDYTCHDADAEETQTTVSLVEEEPDPNITLTHEEDEFVPQDGRFLPRTKRSRKQLDQDVTVPEVLHDDKVPAKQPQKSNSPVEINQHPQQLTVGIARTSNASNMNNEEDIKVEEVNNPQGVISKMGVRFDQMKIQEEKRSSKNVNPTVAQCVASDDGKTPTKHKFTFLNKSRSDMVSSLVEQCKEKRQAARTHVTEPVTPAATDCDTTSKLLEFDGTRSKVDVTPAAADCDTKRGRVNKDDEEEESPESSSFVDKSNWGELLAYVGTSPPCRKFDIPKLEEYFILDLEGLKTKSEQMEPHPEHINEEKLAEGLP